MEGELVVNSNYWQPISRIPCWLMER